MDEGTEKTANKIGSCEPGVESNWYFDEDYKYNNNGHVVKNMN